MPLEKAVREAGKRRLRPILMTTLTTVLGLFPLALGLGDGGETQAPMARAVIGGLTSSTVITLFFVPAVYLVAETLCSKKKTQTGKNGADRRRAGHDAAWTGIFSCFRGEGGVLLIFDSDDVYYYGTAIA